MSRYEIALAFYRALGAALLAVVCCGVAASVGRRWEIRAREAVVCSVLALAVSVAVVLGVRHGAEPLFHRILLPHIVTGFVLMFAGAAALVARKGGGAHNFAGRCYYWLMAATSVNVLILALIHLNPFGVFFSVTCFYLLYSGSRFLPMANATLRINQMDCVLFLTAALGAAGLVAWALVRFLGIYFQFDPNEGIRSLLFGVVGGCFLWHDFRALRNGLPFSRARQHLLRMLATFVGSVSTASLVLLRKFVNPEVAALWPYVVGIPLAIFFLGKFRAAGKSTLALAEPAPVTR